MIRLLLFLLFLSANSLYAQDKKVYLPEGERHPYFNKFIYILDDDADYYFLVKAYRLLEGQQDINIDFLLYFFEKNDVYRLPLPKDSVYPTDPIMGNNLCEGYEYTISWQNGNKNYTLNASNKYKELPDELMLVFKGLSMEIEEKIGKHRIKKK